MIRQFLILLCLVGSATCQGLFDFFGFGAGTGGGGGLFGSTAGYDPWMTGGGFGGGGVGGGGFGPDPAAQDARLTMAEEQMAEVMGESPRNSPERQRIDRLIQTSGGRFSGDAAPLNYLVQEYLMTTPGPALPPPQPNQNVGRRQGGGKRRQGKGRRNRNRQGGRQNGTGTGQNVNGRGGNIQGGAGMQQPQPQPTVPAGRMGTHQQRPQQNLNQAQYPAPNQVYQPAPTANNQAYQAPPATSNQNQIYQPAPPANNQVYQPAPPANNQVYQPAPPANNQVYQQAQPANNQVYQPAPPANNQVYQPARPANNQVYQPAPPANNQVYQVQPPANNQVYQSQSQNYPAQPPTNQPQARMNNNQPGPKMRRTQNLTKMSATKSRQGGGPIAANRLKRIEGRIATVTSQLSQARRMNDMAQVNNLQGQLDALNGVKHILTGGSSNTNKMETIRGRPTGPSQGPPKRPAPQQTPRPYGPPQLNRNNAPVPNNNAPNNYNNFQETNIGGQLVSTWKQTAQAPPQNNAGGQNQRQPPAQVKISPYQNGASQVGPYAPQQPAPYAQGGQQQTQPYDPAYAQNALPYDQGMNQQGGVVANNAAPPRAQGRRNGRRGGANARAAAAAPPPTAPPTGTTLPPKLGDTRWIGGAEYVYYDADGFDTFQWVKKSSIPASQLDHIPQKQGAQEGQAAQQGQQAAA